jgi:hypothetical protein
VFVNGRRIVYPPINDMAVARRGLTTHMKPSSGRPMPKSHFADVTDAVWSIMSTIKPEHIDEMNYEDCFSTKVAGLHTSQALFVVLKPGIGFEPGIGSFVSDTTTPRRPVEEPRVAPAPYRMRLLGVFDETTGDPLAGAMVTDTLSGTSALTTATGTVSLLFLPEGISGVRVTKAGYGEVKVGVSISARDTVPVTLVMARKP